MGDLLVDMFSGAAALFLKLASLSPETVSDHLRYDLFFLYLGTYVVIVFLQLSAIWLKSHTGQSSIGQKFGQFVARCITGNSPLDIFTTVLWVLFGGTYLVFLIAGDGRNLVALGKPIPIAHLLIDYLQCSFIFGIIYGAIYWHKSAAFEGFEKLEGSPFLAELQYQLFSFQSQIGYSGGKKKAKSDSYLVEVIATSQHAVGMLFLGVYLASALTLLSPCK